MSAFKLLLDKVSRFFNVNGDLHKNSVKALVSFEMI